MPNAYDLAGTCAVVTGAAKGIGRAIAELLMMIKESPLGRLGRASEVANLVAWLCTEASQFNTGAVFDMSGGRARY